MKLERLTIRIYTATANDLRRIATRRKQYNVEIAIATSGNRKRRLENPSCKLCQKPLKEKDKIVSKYDNFSTQYHYKCAQRLHIV